MRQISIRFAEKLEIIYVLFDLFLETFFLK